MGLSHCDTEPPTPAQRQLWKHEGRTKKHWQSRRAAKRGGKEGGNSGGEEEHVEVPDREGSGEEAAPRKKRRWRAP